MKRLFLTPLCWLLGIMLGTFLAPLAIELIVWILQPDYYRCSQWNSPEWKQFK